jgi:hypothetical protein
MTKQNQSRRSAKSRPAIRIHGLADALKAGAVARDLDVPITLISAPDAVASMGPAWFCNIVADLEQAYPDLDVEAVLDCGDAAGFALAALRRGVRAIVFSGGKHAAGKLADIARSRGARIVKRPTRILDPRLERNGAASLRQWLGGD